MDSGNNTKAWALILMAIMLLSGIGGISGIAGEPNEININYLDSNNTKIFVNEKQESIPLSPGPEPMPMTVLLAENFSAPWVLDPDGDFNAPPGWDVDSFSGSVQYWRHYDDAVTGFPTSNSTPLSAGLWWDTGPQDEWLITPSLDLSNYVNTRLSFNAIYLTDWMDYVGPNEHNYIKVSTDGGINWDILGDMCHDPEFRPAHTGDPVPLWVWYELYWYLGPLPLDLSAYDGEPSVLIAWQVDYSSTGPRGIHCIDDVHVDAEYVPEYYQILDMGWNLVSFPVITYSSNMEKILASIDGKWDYIMAYDPLDPDHWKTNATFRPDQLNDLKMLNHKMGFWIRMTVPDANMTIIGDFPSYVTITLHQGWNLIGYSSFTEKSISEALAGTGYDLPVEGHNATEPYRLSQLSDNYMMKPGEGYWVHVPSETIWIVDW